MAAYTYDSALAAYRAATTTADRAFYKRLLDALKTGGTTADQALAAYRTAKTTADRDFYKALYDSLNAPKPPTAVTSTTPATAPAPVPVQQTPAYQAAVEAYRAADTPQERVETRAAIEQIVQQAAQAPAPERTAAQILTEYRAADTTAERVELKAEYEAARAAETARSATGTSAPASPTGPTGPTAAQQSAFDQIKAQLDTYGLGSLAEFAWKEIVAGKSADEVSRDLRGTPEFAARFPAIGQREKAGLPAISPAEYVAYEKQATERMRAAGLPQGFYDSTADFTTLISNDVSVNELNDRIAAAQQATYNIPFEAQARLWRSHGLAPGSGGLTAFFLDPDKALPLLQRDVQAAQIGGRADQVGFGLTDSQAATLALNGISDTQAQQGFSTLARSRELFSTLPGENGQDISSAEQLGATFLGDASAQQKIDRRRQRRQAEFADGGSYAGTSKGITGLGGADQR